MSRKPPQDMLEFLRRQTGGPETPPLEPERPAEAPPPMERTPRMLVLRRSQAIVAGVAALLLVLLAFLVGRAAGTRGALEAGEARTVFVIRAITFPDSEQGRADARRVANALAAVDQVTLHALARDGGQRDVVVAVGAWLQDPKDDPHARAALERVRATEIAGKRDLASAYFWQIQR